MHSALNNVSNCLYNTQSPFQSPFDRDTEEEATNSIVEGASALPKRGLASTKSKLVIDCVDIDTEAIYTCVAESQNERIVSSTYVHIEGKIIINNMEWRNLY